MGEETDEEMGEIERGGGAGDGQGTAGEIGGMGEEIKS